MNDGGAGWAILIGYVVCCAVGFVVAVIMALCGAEPDKRTGGYVDSYLRGMSRVYGFISEDEARSEKPLHGWLDGTPPPKPKWLEEMPADDSGEGR